MTATNWELIEEMANYYVQETDGYKKECIFADIFNEMSSYIETCASNATYRASEYMLQIPKTDFVSEFNLQLWKSIQSFNPEKGKFKSLLGFRFRTVAEPTIWRNYETKDVNEKDGRSFGKARWDSLDKPVGSENGETSSTLADIVIEEDLSAEEEYFDNIEVNLIIDEFAGVNARYAEVISNIYDGYTGDELAQLIGEGNEYDSKVRKVVQRAKTAFDKFLKDTAVI